jgi:hypothetical protein
VIHSEAADINNYNSRNNWLVHTKVDVQIIALQNILTFLGWLQKGSGLMSGFIEHLQNVTTNNYDSLTELHTPKIIVIAAHT